MRFDRWRDVTNRDTVGACHFALQHVCVCESLLLSPLAVCVCVCVRACVYACVCVIALGA